jgi:hypothetical protein
MSKRLKSETPANPGSILESTYKPRRAMLFGWSAT